MINPETRLYCRLDGLTPTIREQQRYNTIANLGLLEAETIPIFEEATQISSRFLDTPICILSVMLQEWQILKSSVGLSKIGLMNELVISRQFIRSQSLCTYVVDSHQILAITDTWENPVFASSFLVQDYGIRAYLGVPLLTSTGECLGSIAVMDIKPRNFSNKDLEFLEIIARWSISEFERTHILKINSQAASYCFTQSSLPEKSVQTLNKDFSNSNLENLHLLSKQSVNSDTKLKLIINLAEELRTPLTSIMGMTSVLNREFYGNLTPKQKEYIKIIYDGGKEVVSLVDEILNLGILDAESQKLKIAPVDIAMLCEQVIKSLENVAKSKNQEINLSIEPGNRTWLLDKQKVRQILYYLMFNVIKSAESGGVVRIHISRKNEKLNVALWVSHPWLGEGLPQIDFYSQSSVSALFNSTKLSSTPATSENNEILSSAAILAAMGKTEEECHKSCRYHNYRQDLGLLLSCQLAEIHGGQISVQGYLESRYVISLAEIHLTSEKNDQV